ncbi:exo-beta-N-acetylmuramidase NamZ domain-containing protein [Microlunatus sp. GCM10028923]|uniref:exo-beta-N-acetylmuramidase NamZ family protein n=1 Tax=Microlunatus sp. GCM10028923 TaxID=3273400 RepID=UPI003621934C
MTMTRRGALIGAGALAGTLGLGPTAQAQPGRVRTGLELLVQDRFRDLRGQRVGVITNPTGVLPDLRHGVDVMAESDDVELVAVFGPEHGFRGTAQANDSEDFFTDPRTGLPVYDTFETSGQDLADLFTAAEVDTVLFDVQDVGARFYTYIWTMFDSMEAAALAGKRFVVLDRPNPITGRRATGPVLQPEYATFIGRAPIAQQHGMTVGELAELFNAEFLPGRPSGPADLSVRRMQGWRRELSYDRTGLPWVLPSPNLPSLETAYVYPGSCLFSGTNLSQGRGTTRPFQLVGAPFIDHRWAAELAARRLPGLAFREAYFTPTFSTYQGKNCGGVDLNVTDPAQVDAVALGIALLVTLKSLYPKDFAWLNSGTEAKPQWWIDHLTGSDRVRLAVDAGDDVAAIVAGWQDDLAEFRRVRRAYLRY